MKNYVILDLYLGDSGKGKISDYLSSLEGAKAVIRFNGSNNAGHTIKHENKTYKTHCVPSGVLHPHIINLIGQGCNINIHKLLEEINCFPNAKIFISSNAHVITENHIQRDIEQEKIYSIGSTKQGVSPSYQDKYARKGIRNGYFLLNENEFNEKIKKLGINEQTKEEYIKLYNQAKELIKPYVKTNCNQFVNELLKQGGVVFEGAQGTYLDIDMGDYPFVTSSNTTIGSVFTGTGANPKLVDCVIGVFKAYSTYVGTNNSFKDLPEAIGNKLCELGHEYGTTTGRKRRVGWLDLDAINNACEINGVDKCIMTKLDILSHLDIYKLIHNGEEQSFDNKKSFMNYLSNNIKSPIWAVGVGPERKDLYFI